MMPTKLGAEFDSDYSFSSESSCMSSKSSSSCYQKEDSSYEAGRELKRKKSARTLARRSSFKPAKSLTRLPSAKFRRPLIWKSSGGTDLKKKMRRSRSIKLAGRSSIVFASDADASVDYLEAKNCSDGRNVHFQASPHLESTLISNNEDRKKSSNSKQNLASSESSIQKTTCSSAIKESKFPNHLELQPGGSESEGNSIMKVCPYSYCSLHDHRRSDVPPLKRFVSMRRRLLKTQKSMKSESRSSRRAKHSGISKKGTQTSQSASCGDLAVLETSHDKMAVSSSIGRKAGPRAESKNAHGGDEKDDRNVISVTENQTLPEEADEADERVNKPRSLSLNRFVESTEIDNMVSSASLASHRKRKQHPATKIHGKTEAHGIVEPNISSYGISGDSMVQEPEENEAPKRIIPFQKEKAGIKCGKQV
ncbi:hypothetical protein NC653_015593 [Populus alba x Populus x berolinensis]|uniref:Uncharacterized protein n=1 Tax=Populus alba x Populus x berolinensis TaxID=444605 RepID=A0AAD6QKT9_9ROSI|nr:hypothetical protein NC653_015593 [Populus alba x Populus x berolinensis]